MSVRGLFLASLLAGISSTALANELTSLQEEIVRPAKLMTIQDPASQSVRTFPGEVKATARTELAFRVSGELIALKVSEGEEVKKDQLLARIDPTDYDVTLQRYEAEYKLAKQQFERIKTMLQRKLVSQSQYDEKAAELSITRAALRQARLNRKYTEIHAPYDGVISQRLVENFQNLQAKQPVLILQSNNKLDIEFQLSEAIISQQTRPEALNYQADVVFDVIPDKIFKAVYRERTTEADPATGAYTITLTMPKPVSLQIYPGMAASVSVDLSKVFFIEQSGFVLPVEAVISDETQPLNSTKRQIWKVDPETMRVHRADVEVGNITSKGLQVTSGLDVGDIVVVAGANYMREGMKVRQWERERGL
ncbi:efflux RND transporter periplasmic adaptor subunit [Neptuniibacter caesariensis]|uniref:RND efflux system membrane fusion protein n=1 Tax=Neptuniibacter caesariensis TaxID=207954 RepID=A0A7U8C4F8_NEPCE|nr:efflux RND transporter periplasmic adaptor subunit [Neptuniibacter caesariensis]EAR61322.1 RND efflux system membrane fusion protein [Oceanospirillum sp. MED92] [Neptuniibacter caesariensis]